MSDGDLDISRPSPSRAAPGETQIDLENYGMRVELHEIESGNFEVTGCCSHCGQSFKKAGSSREDGSVMRFNGHARTHTDILEHAIWCGKAPGLRCQWRFDRIMDVEPLPPPNRRIEWFYTQPTAQKRRRPDPVAARRSSVMKRVQGETVHKSTEEQQDESDGLDAGVTDDKPPAIDVSTPSLSEAAADEARIELEDYGMRVELHESDSGVFTVTGCCSLCGKRLRRAGCIERDGSVARFKGHTRMHTAILEHAIECGNAPGPSSHWRVIRRIDVEPLPPPARRIEWFYSQQAAQTGHRRGLPAASRSGGMKRTQVVEEEAVGRSKEDDGPEGPDVGVTDTKLVASGGGDLSKPSLSAAAAAAAETRIDLEDYGMRVELHEIESGTCEVTGCCSHCGQGFKRAGNIGQDGSVLRFNGHAKTHTEILDHAIRCGKAPGPISHWRFDRRMDVEPLLPPNRRIEWFYSQTTAQKRRRPDLVAAKRRSIMKRIQGETAHKSTEGQEDESEGPDVGVTDTKASASGEIVAGETRIELEDYGMRVELQEIDSGNFEVTGCCNKCGQTFKQAGFIGKDGSVMRFNGHAKTHSYILAHAIQCGKAPGPRSRWRFDRRMDVEPLPPPNRRIEWFYCKPVAQKLRRPDPVAAIRSRGMIGKQVPQKEALPRDTEEHDDESEGPDLGVTDRFGPSPRVRLHEYRFPCDRKLLPRSAEVLLPHGTITPATPVPSPEVLADAANKGFCNAEAPAFLGSVPSELLPRRGRHTPQWRCLLVVGPSGSGKTSILRSLLASLTPDSHETDGEHSARSLYPSTPWIPGQALIDHFGDDEDGQGWLCAVGLSSVPTWCKPFEALSVGERYRANVARTMARAVAQQSTVPLFFDEWTSELDRGVARSVCIALRKRLEMRRAAGSKDPPLVLATCHEDVQRYMKPDAVVRCQTGQPPRLEFALHKKEGGPTSSGMLHATIRGILQPVPSAATIFGRWRCASGDDILIFKGGKHIKLRIQAKIGILHPGSEPPEEQPKSGPGPGTCVENDADNGADSTSMHEGWLCTRLPQLGLSLRLRSSGPDRLAVQTRQESEELSELRVEVQQARETRLKHVEPLISTKERGLYPSNLPVRLNQLSKLLKRDLTEKEKNALKVPPVKRDVKCQSIAHNLHVAAIKEEERLSDSLRVMDTPNAWSPDATASRIPFLSSVAADWMLGACDEECSDAGRIYSTRGSANLSRAGWYVPPEARDGPSYVGMQPKVVSTYAPQFRFNPRIEARPSGAVHLASYVGQADGSISDALSSVATYLDAGFDGLCVHEVPNVGPALQKDDERPETQSLNEFSIGICVGPSGSGKTTWAAENYGLPLRVQWCEDMPALAHFTTFQEAEPALAAASLDIATAMRPIGLLSSGERERVTLAWALAELASGRRDTVVIDEFTSLVDRATASKMAHGLTVFVRSQTLLGRLVLLSCHTDVIKRGLLEPDWIFECGPRRLLLFDVPRDGTTKNPARRWSSGLLRRQSDPQIPESRLPQHMTHSGSAQAFAIPQRRVTRKQAQRLELVVRRALACEWRDFREHHYKDHRLSTSAVCFVAELEGRAAAFVAVIHTGFELKRTFRREPALLAEELGCPTAWCSLPIIREHRTVVLPDSQGFGLGSIVADAVAHTCSEMGYVFMSTTAHPTYGSYRDRSPLWLALPSSQKHRPGGQCRTFSHIWIGATRRDGSVDAERLRFLKERIHFSASFFEEVQTIPKR